MRNAASSIFFTAVFLSSICCYAQRANSDSIPIGLPSNSVEEKDVVFHNGEVRLAGTLVFPKTEVPVPALVVLHSASGASRDYGFYQHLKELAPRLGIAVLVFDRRGSGESSGNFQTADFDDLANDAVAALDFLAERAEIDQKRIGVWGVSQGGWIATLAASKSNKIAFVISVSGPGVSPAEQMIYSAETSLRLEGYSEDVVRRAADLRRHVDEYYRGKATRESVQRKIDEVRNEPWFQFAYLSNRGLPTDVATSKWFLEMDHEPIPVLKDVDVPMLFFFGAKDRWVPVTASIENLRAATVSKKEVTILNIEGADHYLMISDSKEENPQNQRISPEYLQVLQEWLKKFL